MGGLTGQWRNARAPGWRIVSVEGGPLYHRAIPSVDEGPQHCRMWVAPIQDANTGLPAQEVSALGAATEDLVDRGTGGYREEEKSLQGP